MAFGSSVRKVGTKFKTSSTEVIKNLEILYFWK